MTANTVSLIMFDH